MRRRKNSETSWGELYGWGSWERKQRAGEIKIVAGRREAYRLGYAYKLIIKVN